MYEKYLDPIIESFTTGDYYEEVYNAKQEYFEKAGVVYEDDLEFEQRMNIFLDWYIFDRDLPGVDLPPVPYYFRQHRDQFTNEESSIYRDLCSTIHSIYRLKRFSLNKQKVVVYDMISHKSYKVSVPTYNQGFSRGDIFEARIVPFKEGYEFSKGFCFHPVEMEKFIVSEINKVRHQSKSKQTRLILQLSAMKLKHLRFQHIDVQHVYRFDSKL